MEKHAKELLRKQLELLAERSQQCSDELLPTFTAAMVETYRELTTDRPTWSIPNENT